MYVFEVISSCFVSARLIMIISLHPDHFWEKGVMQIVIILQDEKSKFISSCFVSGFKRR